MGIQEDADRLIIVIASFAESPDDPMRGAHALAARHLSELAQMDPATLNNAVELLELDGYLKVRRVLGGAPYRFKDVQLNANGRRYADGLAVAQPEEPVEKEPGRFVDFAELGEGNEGKVWQATDTKLKRIVAIKFVHEKGAFGRSVVSHARALTQLQHPHVVTAHDVVPIAHPESQEIVEAVVMEKVDGIGLDEHLGKPMTIEESREIAKALISVVSAYHAKGLAHMDLFDHNVMVSALGIKVLDPIYRDSAVLASTASLAKRQQRDTANIRDILIQLLYVADVAPDARTAFVETTIKASPSELGCAFEHALSGAAPKKVTNSASAVGGAQREVLEGTYDRLRRLQAATRDLISLSQYDPPTPAEREAREIERGDRFEKAWSALQDYNLSNALYLGAAVERLVERYMELIIQCVAGWRAGRGTNADPMSWVRATQSLSSGGTALLNAITTEMQRLLGVS